jgi:hypothetical protein
MRKPGIPAVNLTRLDQPTAQLLLALKENVELLTGARPNVSPIPVLAPDATTEQIIDKINEIVSRLNFDSN